MNKTVNADETVAPEQGWRFRRTVPSMPKVYRSVTVPRWAEIARVLFASCSPSSARANWSQLATWIVSVGHRPGRDAQFY